MNTATLNFDAVLDEALAAIARAASIIPSVPGVAGSVPTAPPPAAPSVFEYMNTMHAVINIDGKAYILTETTDGDGRETFELSRKEDMMTIYENRPRVTVQQADGSSKKVHPFKYWLSAGMRREFKGVGFFATKKPRPDFYNVWRGLAVKPRPGDWSLLRNHIWNVICSRDPALFKWVMAWLADGVRRPGETAHTVLVLVGKEGTGKNKLIDWYGKIFGRHYLMLTAAGQLTGRFNQHLAEAVLVFANEAVWAGDKSALGALKSMATDSQRFIEGKGVNGYMLNSAVRIVMASNEQWVVPAGDNARRFAVLEVSEEHMRDYAYFAAIDAQMEAGGLEAMLHELQTIPIDDVQLREPPYTRALLEQKEHTLAGIERFVLDFLRSGGEGLPIAVLNWETQPVEISAAMLHALYVDQMNRSEGRTRRSLETEFGMRLRKMITSAVTIKRAPGAGGRVIRVPALPGCRAEMAEFMHAPVADLFPADVPAPPIA
jgi:hypothetical protein